MKRKLLPLVILLLLTGCGNKVDTEASYQKISMQKAIEIMNTQTGYILLDVRTQTEYESAHIPGAICIPNESIGTESPAELPDKNQTILVYCRSGNRSKQASKKLAKLGYTNVLEFGGIQDWTGETASGSPIKDPDQENNDLNPEKLPAPDFSKQTVSDAYRIVYTRVPVTLLDEAGKESGMSLPAERTVLVTGETEGWVRIRCGGVCYYLSEESVTDIRPEEAEQASNVCGGILYPGDARIVVIDPGHQAKGMKDKEPNGPGSSVMKAMLSTGTRGVSTKIYEYQLNLDVALRLRDELISRGYTVVMTRESNDVTLSNIQRAQIANRAKAGAFVRIHANGSEDPEEIGAFTICQTEENPYNGQLHGESYRLSQALLDGYLGTTSMKALPIWETDTMTGINWSEVPSTIIEMGFMTNPKEDETMSTNTFRDDAAWGMADGLDQFFTQ